MPCCAGSKPGTANQKSDAGEIDQNMKHQQLRRRAQRMFDSGNKGQAIALLGKAAIQAKKTGELESAIEILLEGRVMAESNGELEQAIAFLEEAIALADTLPNLQRRGNLRNNLALLQKRAGHIDAARTGVREAIALLEAVSADADLGAAWHNLGFIERDAGNLQAALPGLETALALRTQVGDIVGIAQTLTELGIVYKDLGQLTKARTYLEQALKQGYQTRSRERANTLVSLGLLQVMLNNPRAARRHYLHALADYRHVGDRENEALALHNLGQLYDNEAKTEKDFRLALMYYQKSLAINEELADPLGVAEDLGSMAALYQAIGENELARKMHLLALQVYESVEFRAGKIDALINLGILARDDNNFAEAERWMNEAVQLAQEVESPRLLYEVYFNFGDVYLLADKPVQAIEKYAAAVATIEAIRTHLLLEDEALGYFDVPHLEAYDRLIRLQWRVLHHSRHALLLVEQAKAREFLRRLRFSQMLHQQHVPDELLDQEAHLLAFLKETAQTLADAELPDRLVALNNYNAAEHRLQTVWSQIEAFDREYVSLRRGEPASWETIQQSLRSS